MLESREFIEITKDEYLDMNKALELIGRDVDYGGGPIGGRYVTHVDGEVVGIHQFEYEEKFTFEKEIFEKYKDFFNKF